MQNAIEKAIKLAGSPSAMARILGISPQALGKQLKKGQILPHHCIALEKHFKGEISRYELFPQHFGDGHIANCTVIVLQNLHTKTIQI